MNRFLPWRASLALSVIVHIILGLIIFFVPMEKKDKEKPFMTRLVTPEELRELESGRPGEQTPGSIAPPVRPSRPSQQSIPVVPRSRSYPRPQTESGQLRLPPPPHDTEKGAGDTNSGVPAMPGKGDTGSGPSREGGEISQQTHPKPGDARKIPLLRDHPLFDREVIDKLAKKEEGTKRDSTLTFDTEEFRYHTYMERLKEKIEGIWKYPPDAAARGIYGDLFIRFTIRKNGMLGDVELVRTSGHRSLDEAAQRALREAQPFWPLPDEWKKDTITITGHFVYSTYGQPYIR